MVHDSAYDNHLHLSCLASGPHANLTKDHLTKWNYKPFEAVYEYIGNYSCYSILTDFVLVTG